MRALPGTFRADAEVAAVATMIDPSRWGERDRPRPALVDRLQAAVVGRRRVRLTYTGRAKDRSERLVDPWGLVDKDDVWYLVAGTDRGRRTFRLDRVEAVEETAQSFVRPADFDLAEAWEEVVEQMEALRSRTWATVSIESRWVPILRDHFGRHCHLEGEDGDGRSRVRVGAPTPLDLARTLSGWGAAVQVLDPPEVRRELGRIGRELAAAYAADLGG